MGDLIRKVALITGGASGLGKAIAQRLSADGATVVITDVESNLGRQTALEGGFTFFEQNVCDEERWVEIIQDTMERHGTLDILVNNAGILGPTDATNPENSRLVDWQKVFSVNVEGVFLGCRQAIVAMRTSGGGSIINISSVAGLQATPYATAYGASKAAVRQLTKSVAQHCALENLNIRCNSIHPGDVRTPLWDKQARDSALARGISIDEVIAEARAISPTGELALPMDIAAAVSFLASDDARHITGTKLIVDGGVVNCDTYHMTSKYFVAGLRSSTIRRRHPSVNE
jgi:3(or 17)beta-hydroxysteroid dehydrogenase